MIVVLRVLHRHVLIRNRAKRMSKCWNLPEMRERFQLPRPEPEWENTTYLFLLLKQTQHRLWVIHAKRDRDRGGTENGTGTKGTGIL